MIRRALFHFFKLIALLILMIVLLFGILFGTTAILLNQPQALPIIASELSQLAEAKNANLSILGLQGTVWNFSASKIAFKDPYQSLQIQNFHFRFSLIDLLKGNLLIHALSSSSVILTLRERPQSAETSDVSDSFWKKEFKRYVFSHLHVEHFHLPFLKVTFPNGRKLLISADVQAENEQTLIKKFDLNYAPLKLQLLKTASFKPIFGGFTLKDFCLKDSTQNTLCLEGTWKNPENFSLSTSLNLTHLSLLDDLIPDLLNSSGTLSGTVSFSLKNNLPQYGGSLSLKEGSTYLAFLGMHPEKVNAELTPSPQGFSLQASGVLGQGEVSINGKILESSSDKNAPLRFLNLHAKGQNLNLMNLPAGSVDADIDLFYELQSHFQKITGSISIIRAIINGDKLHANAESNEDVVIVSPSGEIQSPSASELIANINLNLGQDIQFKGFGIQANLDGKLWIYSSAGKPLLSSGQFHITSGEYVTYGKKFLLSNGGTLSFHNNPPSNPTLNIKALYDMPISVVLGAASLQEKIQLGVMVSGTVQSPHVSFFSTPPMSQTNILSYILFGTPANKASPDQQGQLSQAALSYALNSNSFSSLNDLKTSLGIDSINIGSIMQNPGENALPEGSVSGQNNTAVFIGKQINDRLYVSYGLGLFNQEQIFKTQYALSRRWTFLTDSATSGNGFDIVYTLNSR